MNLSDMADSICATVRKTDSDSVAACKTFIRRQLSLLWADQLWKSSVIECPVEVDPVNNALHAEGIVLLPNVVGRVLAVRTTNQPIDPTPYEAWWKVNPDQFSQTGEPIAYVILSPVVWQYSATGCTVVGSGAASDGYSVSYLDTDLASHLVESKTEWNASAYVNPNSDGTATSVRVLEKATKPVTASDLVLLATTYVPPIFTAFAATEAPFFLSTPWPGYDMGDNTFDSAGDGIAGFAHSDLEAQVFLIKDHSDATKNGLWTYHYSTAPTKTFARYTGVALAHGSRIAVTNGTNAGKVFELTTEDPILPGVTSLTFAEVADPSPSPFDTIITIPAAETAAPRRQRLKLVLAPTEATTLRVLAKRAAPAWTDEREDCPLEGAENALIALAEGDMLKRGRQVGQAQALYTQGIALLEQMKRLHTVQEAHRSRLIPAASDDIANDWSYFQ